MRKLLALFLFLAAGAHAATDGARSTHLLTQESARLKGVVSALLTQQQRAVQGCLPLTRLQAKEIWVLSDPLFNLDGRPTAGSWQVRYGATFCGVARERNVLFTAKDDGATAAEALQPGTTLASGKLAEDVWKSFQAAAVRIVPGCSRMAVKETQITESPTSKTSLWRELWVARVCERDVAEIVTFYPTPVGTMFRMAVPRSPAPATTSPTLSHAQ